MKECIYNNDKMEYRTVHEICKNEEMKKINHSENDIPCMGKYNKPKIWTKNSKNSEFAVL